MFSLTMITVNYCCSRWLWGLCVWSLFCYAELSVLSSCWGKESWLLYFNCNLAVMWLIALILCLFLIVPWVRLQCVIVACPGQVFIALDTGTLLYIVRIYVALLDLFHYIPVNNFSVMLGWVFLGWTSTMQG